VILEVTEHTPAGVPPLSAVEEQVMNGLYQDAIKPALRTYLTSLREKAYIDIAPGFVDTGASPKQTKPVFAASTPLPEKKKAVQKARLDHDRAAPAAPAKAAPAGAAPTVTAATPPTTAAASPAKVVNVASGKKRKKVKREKIRYGQSPRNSLPAAPEETLTAGADQGAGATSSVLPAPGTAIASIDQPTAGSSDADPLAPQNTSHGKTRYSDRAPVEARIKATAKVARVEQKAAAAPPPLTAEQKATQQIQGAPLDLGGDTATKKKKKKVKGAPKERIQEQAPTPPAPKPDATPIPPKSVRDNGEPVVTPPPSVDTPAASAPATAPPQ